MDDVIYAVLCEIKLERTRELLLRVDQLKKYLLAIYRLRYIVAIEPLFRETMINLAEHHFDA